MLGARKPNASGSFDEAIENTLFFSRNYSVDDILKRAGPVVELAVRYGATFLRVFADVGAVEGLTPVQGLLELKGRYADVMDMEVVAFPQEGILCNPGTEELMREALELGADVVGGIPWFEWTDEDARRHVEMCFAWAEEFRCPLHFLLDDTDDAHARTLEAVAVRVLKSGFARPVTVSHAEAMVSWNNPHTAKLLRLTGQAGIHFSCNAHENLVLNGRFDAQPVLRGIMRVREMLALGINVLSSQDSVMDLCYPFGRMNQLDVAWALGHTIHAQTPTDVVFLFDAVTVNAARAMGLRDHDVAEGSPANLVIIDQRTELDVIRFMGPVRYTIRKGLVTWDGAAIVRGGA